MVQPAKKRQRTSQTTSIAATTQPRRSDLISAQETLRQQIERQSTDQVIGAFRASDAQREPDVASSDPVERAVAREAQTERSLEIAKEYRSMLDAYHVVEQERVNRDMLYALWFPPAVGLDVVHRYRTLWHFHRLLDSDATRFFERQPRFLARSFSEIFQPENWALCKPVGLLEFDDWIDNVEEMLERHAYRPSAPSPEKKREEDLAVAQMICEVPVVTEWFFPDPNGDPEVLARAPRLVDRQAARRFFFHPTPIRPALRRVISAFTVGAHDTPINVAYAHLNHYLTEACDFSRRTDVVIECIDEEEEEEEEDIIDV